MVGKARRQANEKVAAVAECRTIPIIRKTIEQQFIAARLTRTPPPWDLRIIAALEQAIDSLRCRLACLAAWSGSRGYVCFLFCYRGRGMVVWKQRAPSQYLGLLLSQATGGMICRCRSLSAHLMKSALKLASANWMMSIQYPPIQRTTLVKSQIIVALISTPRISPQTRSLLIRHSNTLLRTWEYSLTQTFLSHNIQPPFKFQYLFLH